MQAAITQPVTIGLRWLVPEQSGDIALPAYETAGSAGMDVCAAVERDLTLQAGARCLVPTGFAVAIPAGYEIQVRPRSGLAIRHGITIINSPGTIDSDYRGELRIALVNLGDAPYVIRRGDRIAQLIVAPVAMARIEVVVELDDTPRGSGGFGHTGVR